MVKRPGICHMGFRSANTPPTYAAGPYSADQETWILRHFRTARRRKFPWLIEFSGLRQLFGYSAAVIERTFTPEA